MQSLHGCGYCCVFQPGEPLASLYSATWSLTNGVKCAIQKWIFVPLPSCLSIKLVLCDNLFGLAKAVHQSFLALHLISNTGSWIILENLPHALNVNELKLNSSIISLSNYNMYWMKSMHILYFIWIWFSFSNNMLYPKENKEDKILLYAVSVCLKICFSWIAEGNAAQSSY